ncbi:hypothetical protein [Lysobacter sp. Root604]|uniref:hypothetical protein n=1 Tax=Lysobacter sp. Root604 TaxID=1736568 RepID=UPI0007022F81|nr:hypothetical protein [Lysobacter sp. Root604]KRA17259.1 hypothetical protein ASD69_11150 [Lysobacter sp. Root604]
MLSLKPRSLSALIALALIAPAANAAPTCPANVLAQPKTNQLYVLYPTVTTPFPSIGPSTSAAPFNVADLDPVVGSTTTLRNRITDFIVDDYCEFNVKINPVTALPSPTEPRWQIVAVGSDTAGSLFGQAQAVDTNDADPQDYARVWAKSFKDTYGAAGQPLNGIGSTLERWSTAIGTTTSHEAAHNYGAAHGHSAPRPTEDAQNWHIMATGSTGLTGEMRAARNRHFSDTEYEILGHNVGLNTKTLHNWDFVNPNNTNANKMRIKLLSTSNSLSINWWYNGSESPWQNPTVTYTGGTQNFQGNVYYVHNLDFATAKPWSGPTAGVVMPAAPFHTGASFAGSASVIVFDVQLFNGATLLPLAPRLAGYDAGDIDVASGAFNLNFFNTNPAAGALELSEVQIFRSPRMLDISAMMRDGRPVDVRGQPVEFHSSSIIRKQIVADRLQIPLGKLTDPRTVDIVYKPEDCPQGAKGASRQGPGDHASGEIKYCHKGNALSLFPNTYTYLVANVIQPNATYWDPRLRKFVQGPQQNTIYYQVGGVVPDLNRNGQDDLIDIRTGVSKDEDRNGVPDDARPEQ